MQVRGFVISAGAALGLVLAASAANGQAQTAGTRFGVEADFATNNSIGIGAGAFVKFHLADVSEHAITGRATFDYYFPSNSNFGGYSYKYWEIAADGLLDIVAKGDTKPYVGAGLTYAHSSFGDGYCGVLVGCNLSASNTGLHIVGGLNFMGNSKLMPFVEAKIELSSGSEFILKAGIHL